MEESGKQMCAPTYRFGYRGRLNIDALLATADRQTLRPSHAPPLRLTAYLSLST